MKAKYITNYTISTFFLILCFLTSLFVVEKLSGNFIIKYHLGLTMYAFMAIFLVADALKRARFRTSGLLTTYVFCGLFLGTIGLINIIIVNPWLSGGLVIPFIVTILVIIYFRKFFFPFHLNGSDLIKSLSISACILFFLKMIVLWGILDTLFINSVTLGLAENFSISDSFKGYYNLELMSVLWLFGILCYGTGLFLITQTIHGYNKEMLRSIRNEIALSQSDMILLGISNEDLMGHSVEKIEDILNERVKKFSENHAKYRELNKLADDSNYSQKRWISNVSNLLEYKPKS